MVQSYGTMAQAGPLQECWNNHLLEHKPLESSHSKDVAFQTGIIAVSMIGQIPISRICLKAGGGIIPWLKAISNFLGFSALNISAGGEIVASDAHNTPCRTATSVLVGALSAIPVAHLAYSKNENSDLDFAIALIGNALMPICSLNITLSEKERMEVRDLIEKLIQNEDEWINAEVQKDKQAILKLIQPIEKPRISQCERAVNTVATVAGTGVGTLLAGATLLWCGRVTYDFTSQFTDSAFSCNAAGLTVSAVTAELYFLHIVGATKRVFQSVLNPLIANPAKPALAYQLKPVLTSALLLTGYLVTSWCWGPSLLVCEEDFPSPIREPMMFCVPLGLYLSVASAVSKIVNKFVLFEIRHWGDEEKKLAVALHDSLEYFISLLKRSSNEELQGLLHTIEESSRKIRSVVPLEDVYIEEE